MKESAKQQHEQDEAQSVAVVTATPTEPAIETATIEASQPLVVAAPTAEQTTIQLLRSQIGKLPCGLVSCVLNSPTLMQAQNRHALQN